MWEGVHRETVRRLEQRISEHKDAYRKGEERKLAVAEHTMKDHCGSRQEYITLKQRSVQPRVYLVRSYWRGQVA